MIAFANAQHNAHATQDDAHVAIQMQGSLSLLVVRALRGVLGDILSNRAYWVRMGPTRYIEFSTMLAPKGIRIPGLHSYVRGYNLTQENTCCLRLQPHLYPSMVVTRLGRSDELRHSRRE